jgi:hypothetical protein
MQKCWHYRQKNRPTFMSIIEELVPDLDPSFQNVSYFFSEESHGDGDGAHHRSHNTILDMDDEGEDEDEEADLEDRKFYEGVEDDTDEIDDVRFAGLNSAERDARRPFIPSQDLSHHHPPSPSSSAHHSPSHGNRGASSSSSWVMGAGASRGPSGLVAGAGAGTGSGSPVECMLLEELPNGHRYVSPCASPTSANTSSDDSKGSSKSSTGSFPHINGLANGHIYKPYAQRMKPGC